MWHKNAIYGHIMKMSKLQKDIYDLHKTTCHGKKYENVTPVMWHYHLPRPTSSHA